MLATLASRVIGALSVNFKAGFAVVGYGVSVVQEHHAGKQPARESGRAHPGDTNRSHDKLIARGQQRLALCYAVPGNFYLVSCVLLQL